MRGGMGGNGSEGRWIEVRRSTEETDDGWVAMVKLGHGVKEVGDKPCSVADSGCGDVRGSNTAVRVLSM